MAVDIREFTVGDLLRVPRAYLLNPDRTPMDLTGQTVKFRMVLTSDGTVKVSDAAAVVVDATAGEVKYNWAAGDIDTAGTYTCWFIRDNGGETEHFPAQERSGDEVKFQIIIRPIA